MRNQSYGEKSQLSFLDSFGVYLSKRPILNAIHNYPPPPPTHTLSSSSYRLLDLGCGFNAKNTLAVIQNMANQGCTVEATCVDINVNSELGDRIKIINSTLENALPQIADQSYDIIMLISVLEHIQDAANILKEIRRVLKPNGLFLINVPTWVGKAALEYSAFTLHTSDLAYYEMNDHKMYYNKHDLWPLLVSCGFLPSNIKLKYIKFGLNLFGSLRKAEAKDASDSTGAID